MSDWADRKLPDYYPGHCRTSYSKDSNPAAKPNRDVYKRQVHLQAVQQTALFQFREEIPPELRQKGNGKLTVQLVKQLRAAGTEDIQVPFQTDRFLFAFGVVVFLSDGPGLQGIVLKPVDSLGVHAVVGDPRCV